MENWATMGSKKDTKLVKGSVSLTLGHNHVHDFPGNQLPPLFFITGNAFTKIDFLNLFLTYSFRVSLLFKRCRPGMGVLLSVTSVEKLSCW